MKITILLCALATIATGLPTPTYNSESSYNNVPVTIIREKKSPHHDEVINWSTEIATEDMSSQHNSKLVSRQSPVEARNIGFKKPIIIKKKIGYHVYRDSDEEMAHADPHENCRKQVKVKLCDEEPGSASHMAQCFTTELLKDEISDNDIENSIKNAKEAVENLKRGFSKMEHNPPKMANIENKVLEDDLEVHEHIEAARKALEHVQQNFGNLDTLNFHGPESKNENFQLQTSDEERLAQWKEAINNIQRNFEIAKNIEDAFNVESENINLQSTKLSESSKITENQQTVSNLDLQENTNMVDYKNVKSGVLESDVSKNQKEDSDAEMFTSPTEQKELKINLHSDSLKSEILSTEEETLRTKVKNDEGTDSHVLKKSKLQGHDQISELKKHKLTTMSDEPGSDHGHTHGLKTANDNNLVTQHKGKEYLETIEKTSPMLNLKNEKTALLEFENPILKDNTILKSNTDQINLGEFGHMEDVISSEKMEQNEIKVQSLRSQLDTKHDLDSEKDKSIHNVHVLDKTMTLQHTKERMQSKSNDDEILDHKPITIQETELNIPENKHRNSLNSNSATIMSHNSEQQMSNHNSNMRTVNQKHIEPISNMGTEFNNRHQDSNEHEIMRMTENKNIDHKLKDIHDAAMMRSIQQNELKTGKTQHRGNSIQPTKILSKFQNAQNKPSKTMDTQKKQTILNDVKQMNPRKDHQLRENERVYDSFSTPWAHDDLHRNDESLMSPSEEQFINEHMSTRSGQDPNTGHNLIDNHDLQHSLFMKWAQEQQSDLTQLVNIVNDEHTMENSDFINRQNLLDEQNFMRMKQYQNARSEVPDDRSLHDNSLVHLAQEKQRKNLFKSSSDIDSAHLHEILPENRYAKHFDLANSHDFSQLGPRMHDHLHILKHAMTSDMDNAMQPSMHVNMRESIGKSGIEHNDMHWNRHHHPMARYGSSLPISGINPGAVGVFPSANTGCGIPLMLSCSPSVVSGSLAKPHPSPITAPAYRSGDDLMFYMKRDANDMEELPAIKIQRSSLPFNDKSELVFDKNQ